MEFCDEYGSVVGVMRAGDTFGEAALEFGRGFGTRYAVSTCRLCVLAAWMLT